MITHLLTFDIEHWYESWRLRGLAFDKKLADCDTPCVFRLLDLLDEKKQKATFFFTGNFALEFPLALRECVARGHEVASHSRDHALLTSFEDAEAFRDNLTWSLLQIEHECGVRPIGFRAPKWSLTPENARDFLGVMIEQGLKYDSSVFPGHFANFPDKPCKIKTPAGEICEIPASALRLGPFRTPVGGAWFRIFPLAITSAMFAQQEREDATGVFYAHPYDLNSATHCPRGTPVKLRLIRRVNVKSAWKKLENLLDQFRFTSIRDWLKTTKISQTFFLNKQGGPICP